MANVNVTPSQISEKEKSNALQSFVGSALSGVRKSELVFVLDGSVNPIVAGEYFLPLPEDALIDKSIYDIKVQHEIIGAGTAIQFGLANFDKANSEKVSGKYEVDDTKVTADKFSASVNTAVIQETLSSKLKQSGADYKFVNNDFLVIKNSGTSDITSGKIRIILELYNI